MVADDEEYRPRPGFEHGRKLPLGYDTTFDDIQYILTKSPTERIAILHQMQKIDLRNPDAAGRLRESDELPVRRRR